MHYLIRKATQNDFDSLLKLNKALFDYETQFGVDFNEAWTFSDTGKSYFTKRLEDEKACIYIAEVEDSIVGYILGYLVTFPYRRDNPFCEVENMFVKEGFRGHGIGHALMHSLIAAVKQKGVKKIRVGALAKNNDALTFYRSIGFHDIEIIVEKDIID